MDIRKEKKEITTPAGGIVEKDVYIETRVTTQEYEISPDYLDSLIIQKENTVIGLEQEIEELKKKREFMLSL